MRQLSVWMTGVCVGSVIASAQASEPATNPDEVAASSVQISATRDPELKSYRQLLKGLNAYESHLSKAPDSVFRFLLIPQKPDVSLHDVGLRIVSDDSSIPIPVANDGGFTLPRDKKAEADNADLLTNQKKELSLAAGSSQRRIDCQHAPPWRPASGVRNTLGSRIR
jgi:hypothetical protein